MGAASPSVTPALDTLSLLRAGRLDGARRLDLSCGLTHFPDEIFDLADSLEVLNLSGNALDNLPADLGRLHRLRVLFCSNNRFTVLPESLRGCAQLETVGFRANQLTQIDEAALPPGLRALILTENRLTCVPDALSEFAHLEKLMLSANQLQCLPEGLQGCAQLALLRIAVNALDHWPTWLHSLPRLAWVAGAGNPVTSQAENRARQHPRSIDWQSLRLQQVLGEGTSGVIHQALWAEDRPVAVKLFKSGMTTDGSPLSEMAACLAAGVHPHLIGVQACITGHPDGREGLVMPLIGDGVQVLAGPPSLQTCSRDVYPEGARFTGAQVLGVAYSVAQAMAHLHHACGLLHGDLYAHNILWHPRGVAWLGDLGAAAFLPEDATTAFDLMRVEVRAYACLLDELLQRCDEPLPVLSELRDWQRRCDDPEVRQRPLFAEISQALVSLQA